MYKHNLKMSLIHILTKSFDGISCTWTHLDLYCTTCKVNFLIWKVEQGYIHQILSTSFPNKQSVNLGINLCWDRGWFFDSDDSWLGLIFVGSYNSISYILHRQILKLPLETLLFQHLLGTCNKVEERIKVIERRQRLIFWFWW